MMINYKQFEYSTALHPNAQMAVAGEQYDKTAQISSIDRREIDPSTLLHKSDCRNCE